MLDDVNPLLRQILSAIGTGVVVVVVSEIARRHPRFASLLLTLPIVVPIVFVIMYFKEPDLAPISRLSRETLLLIPLGLPFFVPIAFAHRLQLSFWPAFLIGAMLVLATVSVYLWLAPSEL